MPASNYFILIYLRKKKNQKLSENHIYRCDVGLLGGSAGLELPRAYGVRGVTGNAGVSGLDEPLKCDVSLSVSVRYDENDSSRT